MRRGQRHRDRHATPVRQRDVDPGIVNRASWFSVAYLPQEVSIELGSRTLFEEAESAFDDVLSQQEQLERVGEELALLDSLNMGKPVMDAYNVDVPGAAYSAVASLPGL